MWTQRGDGGNGLPEDLYTGKAGNPTARRIGGFYQLAGGTSLTALDGDGATLAFTWVSVFESPVTDCICHWALAGGRVVTIVDGRRVAVPGAPASVGIAASRGRVALVPGAATWEGGDSARAAPNGPVEVRDALTGAVIATVSPVGTVRAVALSGVRLATLSYDAGVKRVDIWDITTQSLFRSIDLPADAAPEIDLAGKRLVWRAGRRIYVSDVENGASKRLFRSRARPVGVSIEGRRVAWASGFRIRALMLPA